MTNPTRVQKIILLIGLALVAAAGIFPPWSFTYQEQGISQVVKPGPRALIFAPPVPGPGHDLYYKKSERVGVDLDLGRLSVELIVIVATIGSLLVLTTLPRGSEAQGSISQSDTTSESKVT